MKTPIKLIILAALATAVTAAVALKNNKPPASSPNPPPGTVALAAPADPTNAALAVNIKLPKLLDLGAGKCVPCRMMTPILEELKKEYAGKMKVEFIDVWVNPDAAKPYSIQVIPTQIFFDADGKELFRHVGFIAKADILAKWQELGVDLK